MLLSEWPPLLITLWREQHPKALEQTMLGFSAPNAKPQAVSLFVEDSSKKAAPRTSLESIDIPVAKILVNDGRGG